MNSYIWNNYGQQTKTQSLTSLWLKKLGRTEPLTSKALFLLKKEKPFTPLSNSFPTGRTLRELERILLQQLNTVAKMATLLSMEPFLEEEELEVTLIDLLVQFKREQTGIQSEMNTLSCSYAIPEQLINGLATCNLNEIGSPTSSYTGDERAQEKQDLFSNSSQETAYTYIPVNNGSTDTTDNQSHYSTTLMDQNSNSPTSSSYSIDIP